MTMLKILSLAIIEDDDKIRNYLSEQISRHLDVERMESFPDGESALVPETRKQRCYPLYGYTSGVWKANEKGIWYAV